jgi:peptidoglycan/LPS O-acetylase OafA/YrhL
MGILATIALFALSYAWGWGLKGIDFRTEGAWLELGTSLVFLQVIVGSLQDKNVILDRQVFRFTGQISYSWYLWQFPLQALHGWPIGNWGPTGIAFLIATFSTFIVENPLRMLYRKVIPHGIRPVESVSETKAYVD